MAATTTGRVAAFYGPGKPMVIKEYAVPEPEPGAIVVKTTLANICGSDLHQWRGEFDVEKFGRPYPQILGHEMTGTIHPVGEGVTRDTAGSAIAPAAKRRNWRRNSIMASPSGPSVRSAPSQGRGSICPRRVKIRDVPMRE